MKRGKLFRQGFIAFLSVIFLLSAVVGATVKPYIATGEDYANEIESQDIAKLRARDKAIKNATKQAGVVLLAYSKSINSELTEDEVTAITSNSWQLVGEPKYTRTLKQISDNTTIVLWTATVEVNVDDSEIQSWIKRDDKDKSQIITQTREAIKASEENDKKIEDLREKYNRATSQAERESIIKQMNDADRDFLANQKGEEGNKLYYAKDYKGAIEKYNESLKLNPNLEVAYNNRGICYKELGQNERAIHDYDKALEINPNDDYAYNNRGNVYNELGQYERAIQDFDKAIEINLNDEVAYYNRGISYQGLKQYEQAIADYDKAIELNPNLAEAYNNRGVAYMDGLKQYERAIKDYDKAIELNPNYAKAYNNRGLAYRKLNQYERAIQDYNKAIELNTNYADAYNNRGWAYYCMKKYQQALKDFEKALEINPNHKLAKNNREACLKAMGK